MAVSTQQGGCQCGAVRYQVEIDLEAQALSCNCSMCGRSGTLLQFVPETAFKLEKGEEVLTDYLFNKHAIHHVFCNKCGIKPFARGTGQNGPMPVGAQGTPSRVASRSADARRSRAGTMVWSSCTLIGDVPVSQADPVRRRHVRSASCR